jgi:hypothetical protein
MHHQVSSWVDGKWLAGSADRSAARRIPRLEREKDSTDARASPILTLAMYRYQRLYKMAVLMKSEEMQGQVRIGSATDPVLWRSLRTLYYFWGPGMLADVYVPYIPLGPMIRYQIYSLSIALSKCSSRSSRLLIYNSVILPFPMPALIAHEYACT